MNYVRELRVEECGLPSIKQFVEAHHYSHSVFGVTGKFFFRVMHEGELVGAAIFGAPAGMGVAKKYDPEGKGLVELRRFVMVDEAPRNSESRAIGAMLRALKQKGVAFVLSYADPAAGHLGTIYRATNFKYLGTTSPRRHVMWNGVKYPDRNIHQTHFPYHLELRKALEDGSAARVKIPGKHTYLLELR